MRRFAMMGLCALFLSSSLSCSVNVLETFANKNTDEAYYYDALKLINAAQYDAALEKMSLMSATYLAKREIVMLKASAYAGKCGLVFLQFASDLAGMRTTRLFPFLLGKFVGGTPTKIDACSTAETLIQGIGSISARTSDENMALVLISFAKIGNVLSLYADSNQNGVPDPAFNACTETPRATRPTAAVAGDWFNADLRQFGSGITLALANIGAVSGSVDLGSDSMDSITDACDTLETLNPAYNFCSITDPAAFTTNQLKGIKSMLKESTVVGLGTDCTGDIQTCNCP